MQTTLADKKRDLINTFLLVLGYGLFFYCLQVFLYHAGLVSSVAGDDTLLRWDSGVYQSISQFGYTHNDDKINNTGCYVLFPWVWRLLHANVSGICVANYIFFAVGFTLVTGIYKIATKEKLLWLTTPSLYFMAVPYTEALFCLLTAMSFYGIFTQKRWLIWLSLFLVSLTRATAVFLIPSLLIMELVTNNKKDIVRVFLNYLVQYAAPTLAGLVVFVLVQYHDTGIWLAYYKQQVKYLGHEFSWPALPFSNPYAGDKIIWLSALAILVCFVSSIMIVRRVYEWIFKSKVAPDKLLILTLTYLPVILLSIIFCSPKWGTNTTNVPGIHRYVLCTPFIFIFLYHFVSNAGQYAFRHFIAMFILCNITWLSVGAYIHLQQWLFFNFITLLVFGYMLHANRKTEWATLAIIAINVVIQVTLFQLYLTNIYTE